MMLNGCGIQRKAKWAALGLVLSAFAAPASAATSTNTITAYYRDPAIPNTYVYPGPAQAILTIDVTASVGGTCGFAPGAAPSGTVNAGAIDTNNWSQDVPFTLQCTAPWRIAVSSANGALKTTATGATGYATTAPYNVALNLPFDTGTSTGTVTGSCPVAEIDAALSSSPCTFRGTATTTNGLQVPRSFNLANSYMRVSAPAYTGANVLVQGTYNDTLIVTVSPSV